MVWVWVRLWVRVCVQVRAAAVGAGKGSSIPLRVGDESSKATAETKSATARFMILAGR